MHRLDQKLDQLVFTLQTRKEQVKVKPQQFPTCSMTLPPLHNWNQSQAYLKAVR